jgi:hypothetical protein
MSSVVSISGSSMLARSAVAGQLSLGQRVSATAGELSSQSLVKPTEATAPASAPRWLDRAATTR